MLYLLQELDDILAAIIYKVRKTQNFSGPDKHITKLLDEYTKDTATLLKIKTNWKNQYLPN